MDSARSDGAGPAERLGRYQLVTEIGSGPLGSLHAAYVCAGPEEGRIVALRRLPISVAHREAQKRVSRAGITAMSLRHPRLTAVLDVLPQPNEVVVVSEYFEAATLGSVLTQAIRQRAPLPSSVAIAIATDVLGALSAARDSWRELTASDGASLGELVHGGLLPDSVLVASFGESMLADVGIAGAAARAPELANQLEAIAYRAPEQRAGKIDERADVFTVGALLWEMLANRRLPGNGVIARLDQIERPGPQLSPMLVEIVQEALARDPNQRFPSLDAFRDAIRTLARDAIASPEQVAVALGRLVRLELDARRITIERAHGFDRVSALPESGRATTRPPAPDASVRITGAGAFAIGEAPTLRRRSTPKPDTLPAVRAAAAVEPAEAADASTGDVAGFAVPPPASGDERSKRRRTLALVGVLGLVLALALTLASTLGDESAKRAATTSEPKAPVAPAADESAARAPEAKTPAPPVEPTSTGEQAPARRTAPAPEKPERRPERAREPAPGGKRTFRPRGI